MFDCMCNHLFVDSNMYVNKNINKNINININKIVNVNVNNNVNISKTHLNKGFIYITLKITPFLTVFFLRKNNQIYL